MDIKPKIKTTDSTNRNKDENQIMNTEDEKVEEKKLNDYKKTI